MAIVRRGKSFLWVSNLDGRQRWTKMPCEMMSEAKRVERECLTAMGTGDYSFLCAEARETLIRLYTNQGWNLPTGLRVDEPAPKNDQHMEIVLWDPDNKNRGAVQLFFSTSLIRGKGKRTLDKYTQCIKHLLRILGPDARMADLWTDDLREYYAKRIAEKASPNTIGWEISTLSAIYGVLIDKKKETGITENPCSLVRGKGRGLKFASRKRQAYLSRTLVEFLTGAFNATTQCSVCPTWLQPIIWTSFCSGMRLGEILDLRRHQVHLSKRMIYLAETETKERQVKRVPVHRELTPILEKAMRVNALGDDHMFLLVDRHGARPVTKDTVELAMRRICKALRPDPRFRFHDLRHTWRANASGSGIPDRIAERIMGHSDPEGFLDGELPVNRRYGRISDEELIRAIDRLTFDHGESEIAGRPLVLDPVRWVLDGRSSQEKRPRCNVT